MCGFGGEDGKTPAEGFLKPRTPRFTGINRVLKRSRRRAGDTFAPARSQLPAVRAVSGVSDRGHFGELTERVGTGKRIFLEPQGFGQGTPKSYRISGENIVVAIPTVLWYLFELQKRRK